MGFPTSTSVAFAMIGLLAALLMIGFYLMRRRFRTAERMLDEWASSHSLVLLERRLKWFSLEPFTGASNVNQSFWRVSVRLPDGSIRGACVRCGFWLLWMHYPKVDVVWDSAIETANPSEPPLPTETIQVDFQITGFEWGEAGQTLGLFKKPWQSMLATGIGMVGFFVPLAYIHKSQPELETYLNERSLPTLYLGAGAAAVLWLIFRNARRVKGNRHGPVTFNLNDQAIELCSGGSSIGRWSWEELSRLVETRRLLVFRLKNVKAVVPVPKRALTPSQLRQVQEIAAASLVGVGL